MSLDRVFLSLFCFFALSLARSTKIGSEAGVRLNGNSASFFPFRTGSSFRHPAASPAKRMASLLSTKSNKARVGTAMAPPVNNAVVVGAGPAGLATAISLADRGWDVTILEQRKSANAREVTKSYVYSVDARGQAFLNRYNLTSALVEKGVSGNNFTLTVVGTDGSLAPRKPPVLDPNRPPSYWIAREPFLQILRDAIEERPNAKIIYNTRLADLEVLPSDEGNEGNPSMIVTGIEMKSEPEIKEYLADLVVGADGINSGVRSACRKLSGDDEGFTPQLLPSPSSGLRYKILRIPSRFPLDKTGNARASPEMAYAISSPVKARKKKGRLGLLPVGMNDEFRTANVIQPKDHEIWNMKEGPEVKSWLEKTFPQLPVGEIFTEKEIETFAKQRGGEFPSPQFVPRLQCSDSKANVVLVGDAIHAFPPDIGQGVNAALEDVVAFEDALDKITAQESREPSVHTSEMISKTLSTYQEERAPDVKGVAYIAQNGFPYQYSQSVWGKRLWFVNFILRTFILSKLFPSVFDPNVFILVQNNKLRYSEIWTRAQRTTARMKVLGSILAVALGTFWLRAFLFAGAV